MNGERDCGFNLSFTSIYCLERHKKSEEATRPHGFLIYDKRKLFSLNSYIKKVWGEVVTEQQ